MTPEAIMAMVDQAVSAKLGMMFSEQIDPNLDAILQRTIAIPYTTTLPTFKPTYNGYRTIYNDGSHYWLYIYANGAWSSQELNGAAGAFPVSPAQGDLLYFNGTNWVSLAAGTSGQLLKTSGAGANPSWTSALPLAPSQGDVLYYSGSSWTSLAPGTSGQFLKTLGAAANPAWASPGSNMQTLVSNFTVGAGTSGSSSVSVGFPPKFCIGLLRQTALSWWYWGVWCATGGESPNGMPIGNVPNGVVSFLGVDGSNYLKNLGVSGNSLTYDYANATAGGFSIYLFITG